MFWFFSREACGIPAPQPGIETTPLALESKVLITGPPGKSSFYILDNSPLLDVSFANIFSQSMSCLPIFLILSFTEHLIRRDSTELPSSLSFVYLHRAKAM